MIIPDSELTSIILQTAAIQAVFMAVMAGVLQKDVPSKGEGIVGAACVPRSYLS